MPRLLFVDPDGRFAILAAGMAALQGVPGFSEAIPCAIDAPSKDPLWAASLAEVGLHLPPVIRNFHTLIREPDDLVIGLGDTLFSETNVHWRGTLPPENALPLIRRAGTRITRDRIARLLEEALPLLR